ncbi:MAG: tetratricopeptide repeat protein [Nitrosomonadales bacterium]|nr:MAG: tetratricopeptide repeat protein [Nitrosomonadales bacterium]
MMSSPASHSDKVWTLTGEHQPVWPLALLLLGAISLLYMGFLWNPVMFDDLYFFDGATAQAYGHSAFSLHTRWLPYASLGWTANWFGQDLIGFRLGNMALHGASAVALFLLLRRLFGAVLPREQAAASLSPTWLAFFGALLFALHPVAVYAVGYLIQRTILMATLFSLLSWRAYLEGLLRGQQRWFFISVACYLLAVLCKEHAVMVPAVTLAMTLLLHPPSRALFRRIAWPFIAFAVIAVWVVLQQKGVLGAPYELYAQDMLKQLSESQENINIAHAYPLSVMTQCLLFFKYLLLWIVPNPAWMSVDMREPFATSLLAWQYVLGVLGFVLFGAAAVWLLLQRGTRGLLGFAMLFPWLLFATELSSVRIQEPFVLYRSYLWMGGIFAALPVLFRAVPARRAFVSLLAVSLLMFPLAWDRLTTFSHPLLLWDDAASLIQDKRDIPGLERIYHNRGLSFYRVKMKREALDDYNRALALKPDDGYVYNDRGAVYLDDGRYQEALRDFDKAVALVPNYPRPYLGRALVLEALHDRPTARENYLKACGLGMSAACIKLREMGDN